METKKTEIVVLHESVVASWLKDICTFGVLAAMLYANVRWFGDHAIVALAFVFLIVIAVCGRASKMRHDFTEKEEAVKYIQSL